MKHRPLTGGLVYSTELGRTCPKCRQALAHCVCKAAAATAPIKGKVRVVVENKGRGGKTVTLVRGLALDAEALSQLAKAWRSACGSGGTVKDGVVEVQGEHQDKLSALLRAGGLLK